ncbi:cob(I)yrinic acid a,c-diamide adenosyltransferase [Aurantimonas sp. HBX-1]|uniref:cob(I)yrinic acid a,c-diamide adenosyltransferase n=1 Tax=Aurantimonas sp. HBX-1 TaxID=2906072 RepID=UPI001F1ABAAA|nr:cob(I)yrinic acid a,c-diamide adenosyltransferase [Aurantimonas sp. HBX-1]UIJ72400.1 cob(I)yrinic acid a,c-diamide adenosyltransferase [Aurantimonas sp. HBX-1]
MVKLNRIYTRTGDAGETGLGNGERRLKSDLRVETYGTVDELNAVIGLARLSADAALDAMLARIQNELFDLGAELATPLTGEPLGYEPLKIIASQVERLEREIDAMNERLEPLKSFVLPAGSAAAAHLHLARTVARRAERLMVALGRVETVEAVALAYVNRLSDHLFVASRIANDDGRADVLWVPGQSR